MASITLDDVRKAQLVENEDDRFARLGFAAGRLSIPCVEDGLAVVDHYAYTGQVKKMIWAYDPARDPKTVNHFQYYHYRAIPWEGKEIESLHWIADFCAIKSKLEFTRIRKLSDFPHNPKWNGCSVKNRQSKS